MARNQAKLNQKIKAAGLQIITFNLLILNSLPAMAQEAVLSVVKSEDNATQWQPITARLQAAGVGYCVISLKDVKTQADWGQRRVLFLPNVGRFTSEQAIALEEWVSNGGLVITSGPIGNSSALGARELVRSLVGGYWEDTFQNRLQLQPTKAYQEWAKDNSLFGQVRGGVITPNDTLNQIVAVWNTPDHSVAVLTTDTATFFGWRWGTDAAATADVDTAWLKAAIYRYLKDPSFRNNRSVPGASPTCLSSVTTTPAKPKLKKQHTSSSLTPGSIIPQWMREALVNFFTNYQ